MPDVRALSLMRIGLALVILSDLCIRSTDLSAHYTDDGFWPVHLVQSFGWKPGYWSLHTLSGAHSFTLILFILHFIFAGALLFGYRTRLATLMVWLLTISLHNRNAYVLQAGDDLLRLVLFWGLFLPWNACYSIDAARGRARMKPLPIAGFGYLLLLASLYFFTVSLKTGSEWRSDHSAVYYALSLDQMRLPGSGDWLYTHYDLMTFLTRFVFVVELIIPALILWPSKRGQLRFAAFLLIVILHLGIGMTLYVGLFFTINIVVAIGLLPARVMGSISQRLPDHRNPPSPLPWLSSLRTGFLFVVIIFCLIVNLSSMDWFGYELRSEFDYGVNVLRLNQYWGMFSPGVMKKDGWFVFHGADSLGRQWDLLRNKDYVDYKKPEHVVSMYKNDRWRKLAENLQSNDYTFLRPLFCDYLLHRWNQKHPKRKMAALTVYFMEKENLPNYKTTPVTKQLYSVCNDR